MKRLEIVIDGEHFVKKFPEPWEKAKKSVFKEKIEDGAHEILLEILSEAFLRDHYFKCVVYKYEDGREELKSYKAVRYDNPLS